MDTACSCMELMGALTLSVEGFSFVHYLSSKNATSFYSNIINIKWCYLKKKKKRDCLATLLPHGWKLKPSRTCRISVRPEVWLLITKHYTGFFPEVRIFNQHRGLALLASSLSPTILLFLKNVSIYSFCFVRAIHLFQSLAFDFVGKFSEKSQSCETVSLYPHSLFSNRLPSFQLEIKSIK